jgi:hypothetical protein
MVSNAIWLNLLCFIAGLWLGNRYAIGRDKRTEWNDLTEERRKGLRLAMGSNLDDTDLILSYLPFYRRRGFRKAMERYQDAGYDAQGDYDPARGMSDVDPVKHEALRLAAARVLRYLRRR